MDLCELKISDETRWQRHPWEQARLEVIVELLDSLGGDVTDPMNVLDLGCGDLFVARQLTDFFPQARFFCVDIAFEPALKQKLQTQLQKEGLANRIRLYASLEELEADARVPNQMDRVLMLDVLEHIEDEIGYLRFVNTFAFITSATRFVITVPAWHWLYSRHDAFLRHFRRYTTQKLEKRVTRGGLRPLESGYFFSTLLLPRLAQWGWEKLAAPTRRVRGIGAHQGHPSVDGVVRDTLIVDFRISRVLRQIGVRLPGLSCYALCRQQAS
ncbi:hypothetical protein SAMN05421823_101171 [Catalinimonas alkaloidigena]|uniref:Methyltransferase domain-containing protein n=1 Tax=Catalinimonas alkaloidigena TaxID=1075417 RepID=A0A1G8WU57_9BACT|nr:class I SAM-dependent methyltransferase [Catalinimonas alkaloidigena]SDJ81165.1 hypothetical protein SAMN05421823_101171 [Catalinimonas alkaloidigena]